MKNIVKCHEWLFLTAAVSLLGPKPTAIAQHAGQRSVRTALTQRLPALDGNRLSVNLVEVAYGPDAASPAHSHPCPVIGYVIEGAIRSQVKGQPAVTYHAGESFYESPNGEHLVSANTSSTKPAKLLAIFVCDHTAPLSTPVTEGDQ
jgi:quercetin dioxygenase-like cupin family protein